MRLALLIALLSFATTGLAAQAVHSGVQQLDLVAGVEASYYTPDFGPNNMTGVGTYVDIDWRGGIGAEGEMRFLQWGSYNGEVQSTYLGGPRAFLFPNSRWRPYGKFLLGGGKMTYPSPIGEASYFVMAPGGGLDYILSRHWRVRADYEFQIWPSAPHVFFQQGSMKPNGVSIGIAYRIR
jgi:opacity protein-like surface antigen